MYWSLDWFKQSINTLAGQKTLLRTPPSTPDRARKKTVAAPPDITLAWTVFLREAGAYQLVSMRLPEQAAQPVQFNYLAPNAAHERARSPQCLTANRRDQTERTLCRQEPRQPLHRRHLSLTHGKLRRSARSHRHDCRSTDDAAVRRHRLDAVPRSTPQKARCSFKHQPTAKTASCWPMPHRPGRLNTSPCIPPRYCSKPASRSPCNRWRRSTPSICATFGARCL